MDAAVRESLVEDVRRCLEITRTLGGDYELKIEHGYPPMHNDPGVADAIRQSGIGLLGEAAVTTAPPVMGAEDFSYMTQAAPGAMFRLGVKQLGGRPRHVHTPDFDVDEDALPVGAATLAETALRLMRGG
jgi:amidohydrolase